VEESVIARRTAAELETLIRQAAEPFGQLGWQRLAVAAQLGLPPVPFDAG